jgi:hypothetical protein
LVDQAHILGKEPLESRIRERPLTLQVSTGNDIAFRVITQPLFPGAE